MLVLLKVNCSPYISDPTLQISNQNEPNVPIFMLFMFAHYLNKLYEFCVQVL